MNAGAVIRVEEGEAACRSGRSVVRAGARPVVFNPAGSLNGTVPARIALPDVAAQRGPARYRLRVGEIIAEVRSVARETSGEVLVPRSRALLFIPFSGTAFLTVDRAEYICRAGTPFFYTGEARLSVSWSAGMIGLLVFLRRDRLNAAISALGSDGRRVVATAACLARPGDPMVANEASAQDDRLEQAAERIMRLFGSGIASHDAISLAAETGFYTSLAGRIAARDDKDSIAPPVRAVSEAMRLVADNHRLPGDIEQLAASVGVTGQTLRKGFRLCLGMTVKEYIRAVRLAWARERLDSARDSRSVAELAAAAGFATAASFSHAYVRRFGESPTQTRARAVQRNP